MLAEKTIRKHVAIIHAYSLMSVLQRKIVNVLLYEALQCKSQSNQKSSVAVECRIPFSRLCKFVKFNSNNTQYLKEAVDGLASLKIEWNLLKDKAPTDISFLNLRILHGSPTFYQDNTLNFSFHKIMLDLVDNPSVYGTLDVDLQSEFESKYGHALYENSTRFVNLQKNKIIQLETFRKMLGIQDNKYANMRELTRNVISPSIEEVNDRANFTVSLNTIKSGRKITGFEISVENKKKSVNSNSNSTITGDEGVYKEIKQTFGSLKASILENILRNYSEEYILEKIAYTKKHAKKEHAIYYPIPYFISAIKHDYKSINQHVAEKIQSVTPKENSEWESKLKHLKDDLAHWKKMLEHTINDKNESLKEEIKNIILRCQVKLNQHYLKQPVQDEPVS